MNRTELAKSGKFYTYGHYLDGNLIYIGEGKGRRAWNISRKPYYERRKDVEVRIFGVFDSKELAVFNEGLLIYQERMENNEHLLNKLECGSGSQSGKNCHKLKGIVIGTNRENKTIVFCGEKDMTDRGFSSGAISNVILGKLPHYKKFTFTRTSDIDQLRTILDTADFIDEISRKRIEEFIQE